MYEGLEVNVKDASVAGSYVCFSRDAGEGRAAELIVIGQCMSCSGLKGEFLRLVEYDIG